MRNLLNVQSVFAGIFTLHLSENKALKLSSAAPPGWGVAYTWLSPCNSAAGWCPGSSGTVCLWAFPTHHGGRCCHFQFCPMTVRHLGNLLNLLVRGLGRSERPLPVDARMGCGAGAVWPPQGHFAGRRQNARHCYGSEHVLGEACGPWGLKAQLCDLRLVAYHYASVSPNTK